MLALSKSLGLAASATLFTLLATLSGCASAPDEGSGAPQVATRVVQGKLVLEQYKALAQPGIAAMSSDGVTYDGAVSSDGTFTVTVPSRTPIRLFVTEQRAPSTFIAASRIFWPGGSEWVTLTPGTSDGTSDGVSVGGGSGGGSGGAPPGAVGAGTAVGGGAGASGAGGSIHIGSVRPVPKGSGVGAATPGVTSGSGGTTSGKTDDGDDGDKDSSGSGSGSGSSGSESGSGSSGSGSSGSGSGSGDDGGSGTCKPRTTDGTPLDVCKPSTQSTSVASGTPSTGKQSADLPYDAKLPVGWKYRLSDSFLEKGPYPAAILDVQMEKGGAWRLAELKSDTPFTVTEADCRHEGTKEVGRDRAFVTWRNADGSVQTDHIDMRYCIDDPPPQGQGITLQPAPAPAPGNSPIQNAPVPSGSAIPGCK